MDNMSDAEKERKRGSDSSDSSDSESEHERAGEAAVQVHSPVQVHAPAEDERSSPDYMETRDREERSRSSSSSSDDQQEKAEVEEEVNGEARDGSRRSSSSSASSASPADPCDDQPDTRMGDVMGELLLAFKQREAAEHSAINREKAPADPNQPEITLFVKVRSAKVKHPETPRNTHTGLLLKNQQLLLLVIR